MPISSRTVVSFTLLFLAVGLVALLSIVGTTVWLAERAQVYFETAVEARDTRFAAAELRSAVQTAESGQRGFLVTGNEIYLAPYENARAQAEQHLQRLRGLLSAAAAATRVERLSAIIGEKFAEMDQTIALKRDRRDAEADAIFMSNRGKALMDEANIFFSGIIREADERLLTGVEEQRTNANWLRIAAALGALVIVAVVGGAVVIIHRYTRELQAARDEVHALNAGLERRVSERTADLERARDQAEVLVSEVNHRVANSLALVASLISLQAKGMSDATVREALGEAQDRIYAISLVHKRLYTSGDARAVTLDEYLASLLDHLKSSLHSDADGAELVYALQPLRLPTDKTINLGVVATEWVTNAFKYAYPQGGGEIRVRLQKVDDAEAELVVEDDGVGLEAKPAGGGGTGLGSRIVQAMATSIGGRIEYAPRGRGTTARLIFPAPEIAAQA